MQENRVNSQDGPDFVPEALWTQSSQSVNGGGARLMVTEHPGALVSFKFTGNAIAIHGTRNLTAGTYNVVCCVRHPHIRYTPLTIYRP